MLSIRRWSVARAARGDGSLARDAGRLKQEPGAPLSLVDPVLDQAGAGHVVVLVANRVGFAQSRRQIDGQSLPVSALISVCMLESMGSRIQSIICTIELMASSVTSRIQSVISTISARHQLLVVVAQLRQHVERRDEVRV